MHNGPAQLEGNISENLRSSAQLGHKYHGKMRSKATEEESAHRPNKESC